MRMCMSVVFLLALSIPSVAADKSVGFSGGDLHQICSNAIPYNTPETGFEINTAN